MQEAERYGCFQARSPDLIPLPSCPVSSRLVQVFLVDFDLFDCNVTFG